MGRSLVVFGPCLSINLVRLDRTVTTQSVDERLLRKVAGLAMGIVAGRPQFRDRSCVTLAAEQCDRRFCVALIIFAMPECCYAAFVLGKTQSNRVRPKAPTSFALRLERTFQSFGKSRPWCD